MDASMDASDVFKGVKPFRIASPGVSAQSISTECVTASVPRLKFVHNTIGSGRR